MTRDALIFFHGVLAAGLVGLRSKAPLHGRAPNHGLRGPLIISLTSYLPRFRFLRHTLLSLLLQECVPDRIVLWVSPRDVSALPKGVLQLEGSLLEIRLTPIDLGPHNKLTHSLRAFPDAFLATADDDMYYSPDWLTGLVGCWTGNPNDVVCHRAHGIRYRADGTPRPYREWNWEVRGPLVDRDIFPTGGAGVLYPPGCLAPEARDSTLILSLCPKQDDIWLFWMGRLAGARYRKSARNKHLVPWPGSQANSLMHNNVEGGANDARIQAMIKHFGWPP